MRFRSYFPILLFFCGYQGWILCFPLFGPVLSSFGAQKGVNLEHAVTAFLLVLSISYVCWGAFLSKGWIPSEKLRTILLIDLLSTLFLGVSLYWLPASLWIGVFILLGVLGSLPPLVWLSLVSMKIPERKRGLIFGLTGFFVEFTVYGMNLLVQKWSVNLSFILLQLILLFPLVMLLRFPKHFDIPTPRKRTHNESIWQWWPLFIFIYVIYLGGGMMYEMVNPYVVRYPDVAIYLGNLPYTIAMPFIGLLIDRVGARPFAFMGSVLLGISFALFAINPSFAGVALGILTIKVGFAFLDLFILYFLAYLAYRKGNFTFLGIGIGINMFSILSGSFIAQGIRPILGLTPAFIVAIIVILMSFLLIEWVVGKDIAKAKLSEELLLAQEVQRNYLPLESEFPSDLDIFASLQPAKEIGGDFYDVISLEPSKTLFVIGDVVGKGLSGGMIASSLISHIRSNFKETGSLTLLLVDLNKSLIRDSRSTMHVTLGLALIDSKHKTVTYAGAGHLFPILVTAGEIGEIEVSSFPLGIEADTDFEEVTLPFTEKNTLVLYTDGLIEARNSYKEMFGFERLKGFLQQPLPIKELGPLILKSCKDHSEGEAEDDITLLMIGFNGKDLSNHE